MLFVQQQYVRSAKYIHIAISITMLKFPESCDDRNTVSLNQLFIQFMVFTVYVWSFIKMKS